MDPGVPSCEGAPKASCDGDSERGARLERVRGRLVGLLAELDPKADQSSRSVRLAALAWLVCCGLRRTACCMDVGAVADAEEALGAEVIFEVREVDPGEPYWLSDQVVLYEPGAQEELAPVWAEHRRSYNRGVDLGEALGYFAPRERPEASAPPEIHLLHFASPPGGPPVGLWTEFIPSPVDGLRTPELVRHLRTLGLRLREIGLTYSFDLKNGP